MNKKCIVLSILLSLLVAGSQAFAWQKTIPIPYHPEGFANWSGPATAKMILESPIITADPGYAYKTQAQLWADINGLNLGIWTALYPGVHTDPHAMAECLKLRDTRPAFTYVKYEQSDFSAYVTQKIIYTIDHYDVPPAVPIMGGLNWVTVHGVDTSADPSAGPYTIHWLLVNDPRIASTSLGSNSYIGYTAWENSGAASIFRHISTPDPFPGNLKKIAICDPDTPEAPKILAPKVPPKRDKPISPKEARAAALKSLKDYNLMNKPGFAQAAAMIKTGSPVLVKRDAGDLKADYYIVPLARRYFIFWRQLTGAVLIDAYSGAFMGASRVKKAVPYPYFSINKARKLLKRNLKSIEGISRNKDLEIGTPRLTWKPEVNPNPYMPLWETRATVKGASVIRYLDLDKNIRIPKAVLRAGNK